jgi:hypothetical protein
MPTHIETIEVSPEAAQRGAQEESYATLLRLWRSGAIDDAQWLHMQQMDPAFRSWLHKMGAQ